MRGIQHNQDFALKILRGYHIAVGQPVILRHHTAETALIKRNVANVFLFVSAVSGQECDIQRSRKHISPPYVGKLDAADINIRTTLVISPINGGQKMKLNGTLTAYMKCVTKRHRVTDMIYGKRKPVQNIRNIIIKRNSTGSKARGALCAVNQTDSEFGFQCLYLMRNGRLSDIELVCSLSKAV
ncbi:MAG: hypothetical protein LUF78_03955 [Clostridiales bacterium]|nr:hypothetical protein [Clostridiales bacterium]